MLNTKTQLHLPILGELPLGRHLFGVPINNGSVQIGFAGKPDSIDRLVVDAEPDAIEIARLSGELLQIESGIIDRGGDRLRIIRKQVLAEPLGGITLWRAGDAWETWARLAEPATKVGLSRFAAKIGNTAIHKAKRLANQ